MVRKKSAADETAAEAMAAIAPLPTPEPDFKISYGRSLTGKGKNVKLSDLRALVREASYRDFSEHASVGVLNVESGGIFQRHVTIISITDAKEEIANG